MSTLLAFPGQGAQSPGMLQRLPDAACVQATLQQASTTLGEDVLLLDSDSALSNTRAVQLCLLIAGVAAARLLLQDSAPPRYVAGLSIGAYPAAVIAQALAFDDALRLVNLRGQLMQQAYPSGFGMTAISGLELGTLEPLLAQVNSPQSPVYLANINADTQLVIAGSDHAMAQVAERARRCGSGLARRLAVSVPSHCPLLAEPAAALADAFANVPMRAPAVGYLSGSSARLLRSAEQLRDDLAFNMCRTVDWRGTVQSAYERGVRLHLELPPGNVLSGLARRVFEQGNVVAFDGARLDTLHLLLHEEDHRHL